MNDMKPTNYLEGESAFEGKIFSEDFFEKKKEIKGDIKFTKCIFKKSFVLEEVVIKGKLYFHDCVFETYTSIEKCDVRSLTINYCKSNGAIFQFISNKGFLLNLRGLETKELYVNGEHTRIFIDDVKAKKILLKDINSIYNQRETQINFSNNDAESLTISASSLFSSLFFEGGKYEWLNFNGIFNKSISLDGSIKVKYLFFSSSFFKDRIDFKKGSFENVQFSKSSFEGVILINGIDYFKENKIDLYIEKITVHASDFKNDITISLLDIKSLDLSNNTFDKILHFNSELGENNVAQEEVFMSFDGVNQGNVIVKDANLNLNLSGINLGNLIFKDVYASTIYI